MHINAQNRAGLNILSFAQTKGTHTRAAWSNVTEATPVSVKLVRIAARIRKG
jgi:hypothetical protein